MLAEFYQHLADEFPTHGLELIFVSSDRDAQSFDNYYRSMPWLAIPFNNLATYKQLLSFQYGVQGIPCLVILDALTGQVVSDGRTSRREVMEACQRGEEAIEGLLNSWCQRVPPSSREILDLLQVSCSETNVKENAMDPKIEAYLTRATKVEDTKTRIQHKFTQLVKEGMSANEAAAKAILLASSAQEEVAPLNGLFQQASLAMPTAQEIAKRISPEDFTAVATTARKYVDNARRTPWNPKFRQFKLSNKVADRIARVPLGLDFLTALGIEVVPTAQDFVVSLPLEIDLDDLHAALNRFVEESLSVEAV